MDLLRIHGNKIGILNVSYGHVTFYSSPAHHDSVEFAVYHVIVCEFMNNLLIIFKLIVDFFVFIFYLFSLGSSPLTYGGN